MLQDTRKLILERIGFRVSITGSVAQTAQTIRAETIDLLVMCSSVSAKERVEILTVAHKVQPTMKNLIMTVGQDTYPMQVQDTVADGFMLPEALVDVVKGLAGLQVGDSVLNLDAAD